ncbi:3-dehydroquinate dehydratase [Methanobacterium paludis]|uniref:3-dehydroquinate dehydratase n=2 Tax=Methanobacterium paludis (strain DSM 25820 / JCM 18151 / SWAN1) TaxID=868131 RepID=F6D3T7_METPW|nr:type I 3-dehydroquinate dehydratase [Methanobacterium paludis]AEG18739.1 3-dehydroquinate dehydratase [Methanobacterium paludis]
MICVPILEKNSESVIKSANNAIKMGADILEFRIDGLDDPDPDEIKGLIKDINYPFIATNRTSKEGGSFDGSEEERIEILFEAAKYADFVDIELKTDENYRSKIIKVSKATIISYHDFKKTPSVTELLDIVKRESEIGDISKFAVMPENIQDTLVVLEVLSRVQNTIGISMGNIGKYTRVIAPLFGSPITFASLDKKSAPGQLDVTNTRNILDKLGNW